MLIGIFQVVLTLAGMLIPGLMVALNWHPVTSEEDERGPLNHVIVALVWGMGLVPVIAFAYVLFTGAPLTPGVIVVSGASVTLAALIIFVRRGARVPSHLRRGWRCALPVLLVALAIGLFAFVRYDTRMHFHDSCMFQVTGQVLQLEGESHDLLRSNEEDQRLGNIALMTTFVALHGSLGPRVIYGFLVFAMALGGFLAGARFLGRREWGWFVLAALPLNPYVMSLSITDENFITLGFSALLFALLRRRGMPWFTIGALCGLIWLSRHIMLLSAPAMIVVLWRYEGSRWRAFLRAFIPFNMVSLICHIHHCLAWGGLTNFENYRVSSLNPHRFIGEYPGMLQWPLYETVVRTPWNPFPTFLMWPVYLIDKLGVVLFAALLLGVFAAFRKRTEGLILLLWFAPTYLFLSLQEEWDVPNKMGIIIIIFVPIAIWMTAGIEAAVRSPRRWGLALLLLSAMSWGGVTAIREVNVPVDPRYHERHPGQRAEDAEYVRWERARITSVAPWPNYGRLADHLSFQPWRNLVDLGDELRNRAPRTSSPPYGWHVDERVDLDGSPVVVEVDLSHRLLDRESEWLRYVGPALDTPLQCVSQACPEGVGEVDTTGDGSPDVLEIDLTQPGPPLAITDIRVPDWADVPLNVLTSGGRAEVTGLTLIFGHWPDTAPAHDVFHHRYARFIGKITGPPPDAWATPGAIDRVTGRSSRLRLRIFPGPMTVAEAVNDFAQRVLVWHSFVERESDLSVRGPYIFRHN